MAIVVASYRQTVRAYEQSGGAYIVAKENLGRIPSLVAGSRPARRLRADGRGLDGVRHLRHHLRGHRLEPYRVALSLAAIAFIAFVNLRGVKEAGVLFALPTYAFIAACTR